MKFLRNLITLSIILISFTSFAKEQTLIVKVKKGDTLSKIMDEIGISKNERFEAVKSLSEIYSPSSLKIDKEIRFGIQTDEVTNKIKLNALQIDLPSYEEVNVIRNSDGSFRSTKTPMKRDILVFKASGLIETSLFEAANKSNIPTQTLFDLIKIYSYDVDFQRDIRKGDNFEILYEQYFDEYGNEAGTGELIFASLNTRSQNLRVYRFETLDGFTEYFDQNAKSVKKSFLKTPVDGARITSGYGKRRHPILRYNKMHKGIDFGAPTGTPVYAAGNGYISYLGRKGSYGKFIKINHANGYATAYAHLNGYKKGLKKGSRIKQGQVIGYVGTTGSSTGAHLHYEIMQNNRHINPLSVKATPAKQLKA